MKGQMDGPMDRQTDYKRRVQSYVAYDWKLHGIDNSPISSITYYWLGMWKLLTASVLEDGIATSICTTKWKRKRNTIRHDGKKG